MSYPNRDSSSIWRTFSLLEDLAFKYEVFQQAGCEIASVSCNTAFVHKAWHDASEKIAKIKYPMLADLAHVLAKDFEVLIQEAGIAERGAFVVNPEGRVVSYEGTVLEPI